MEEITHEEWFGWDRTLWGVEFKSEKKGPTLIGGNWHKAMGEDRYEGEPSRAILFTTRGAARKWCQEMNDRYKAYDWPCNQWKFKPVKVREIVIPISRNKKGKPEND